MTHTRKIRLLLADAELSDGESGGIRRSPNGMTVVC